MKVLRMQNVDSVERIYSNFYCQPLITGTELYYFVKGVYYDIRRDDDRFDILLLTRNLQEAMNRCVELLQELEKQPDLYDLEEDLLLEAYFAQCRLEDDSNDNVSK